MCRYELTDDEKWQAVVNCDKNYDGIFFYGVKTTGIFCRPSCNSKTPAKNHVTYFENAPAAMKAGFRICKRCRPDKAVYEPGLELFIRLRDSIAKSYEKEVDLKELSKQLGVSINHIIRLFKQFGGLTPAQYITGLRIQQALTLLSQGDLDIMEIAYRSGFKSLSNFYKQFKRHTGFSPGHYRNRKVVIS